MNYKSMWLTNEELLRIEKNANLPLGTLQVDERADGRRLRGAYVRNTIHKIPDSPLRDRAEFAIQMYCELDSRHAS